MSRIFGEIRQIAFVVEDIDQAVAYWAGTPGIGPFFVKRRIAFSGYVYRGKRLASPTVSIALANSRCVQVELIQQHDEVPSIYREFLDARRTGLQHVSAWFTRAGFDERKALLLAGGMELAQECTIPASGVRLAYFATDTEAGKKAGGLVYEIADLLEPGQIERVRGIAEAAAAWDGRQAVVEVKA